MRSRQVSFPLDDEGFFRRECSLCCREFKVCLRENELGQLAQCRIDNFLVEQGIEEALAEDGDEDEKDQYCPYCGQSAPPDHWWTQEQLAYVHVIASNVMADLLNKHLIRPLKRNRGRSSFIRFEGKEMKKNEEWISPEVSDMTMVDLPCCKRQIKVLDDWGSAVHCFFCGFCYRIPRRHC